MSDVRDTRDGAAAAAAAAAARSRPHVRMACPAGLGEFAELRVFLEDVLGIPKHARRFCVTFADGEAPIVTVDYSPRESPPEGSL